MGYFMYLFTICCLVSIKSNRAGQTNSIINQEEFAKALENFSTDVYLELSTTKRDRNIVFSPFSIQVCMSMALIGAEDETASELQQGMGFGSTTIETLVQHYYNSLSEFKHSPILQIANKIYVNNGLKLQNTFNDVIKQKFYSEAENIDFTEIDKSAGIINSWIANSTNNRIKNLVSPAMLSAATSLILLNAIYFRAEWLHKFPKHLTVDKDFYIDEKNSVKVPMMNMKQIFYYGTFSQLDAKVLEIPYRDSNLAMLIILPNKRNDLGALEPKLRNVTIQDIKNIMDYTEVSVEFPKFHTEFEIILSNTFKKFGIQRMFTSDAQFGKMLENGESAQVSEIIHRAFIQVEEEGTETAATTGVFFLSAARDMTREPQVFKLNHPFHYIIYDTSNRLVLFRGCIREF